MLCRETSRTGTLHVEATVHQRLSAAQSRIHRANCVRLESEGWDVCRFCGVKTCRRGLGTHCAGRKHYNRMQLFDGSVCDYHAESEAAMIQHLRNWQHQVPKLSVALFERDMTARLSLKTKCTLSEAFKFPVTGAFGMGRCCHDLNVMFSRAAFAVPTRLMSNVCWQGSLSNTTHMHGMGSQLFQTVAFAACRLSAICWRPTVSLRLAAWSRGPA